MYVQDFVRLVGDLLDDAVQLPYLQAAAEAEAADKAILMASLATEITECTAAVAERFAVLIATTEALVDAAAGAAVARGPAAAAEAWFVRAATEHRADTASETTQQAAADADRAAAEAVAAAEVAAAKASVAAAEAAAAAECCVFNFGGPERLSRVDMARRVRLADRAQGEAAATDPNDQTVMVIRAA